MCLSNVNLLASSDSDDGTNQTEQIMQWVVRGKVGDMEGSDDEYLIETS